MKFSRFYFFAFALLFTLSSCNDYSDDFTGGDDLSENFPEDNGSNNGGNGGGSGSSSGLELNPEGGIALYRTDGDNIISIDEANRGNAWMRDPGKHQAMWEMVADLIPANNRRHVYSFEVFDGGQELLGYVYNINDKLTDWNFGLDIASAYPDKQNLQRSGDFIHTIIHEYGHILSLNEEQLNPTTSGCNNYNPGEGCAYESSYIDEFHERFWEDIAAEHSRINESDYDALNDFYHKYQNRFWSDYSATNPVEDFAEVFSFFITQNEAPTGNQIKHAKIRMLYEYPELVDLRTHMRGTDYTIPPPGSWARPKGCLKHKHVTM